ncbi:beta-1,3-glucan-binding protein 2-like [Condylostylus longicornis]|uniref:beta-1,3-glucan-binding protein 2-like n=1 Tax=Condylostylus longicornis TaxID=2530218 RepID=UPI00244DE1A0|nr:beta-1,3-glucan-binding protein 2-like [Condylostylus longicornis]
MFKIIIIKCILLVIFFISLTFGQNPDLWDKPTIRYLKKGRIGLEVSIPNKLGLKFFAFHGAINRFIKPNEFGDFYGEVTEPDAKNNIWTYSNKDVTFNENDVLYYWYHYQINSIQQDSLAEQIAADKIDIPKGPCKKSHTLISGKAVSCSGEIIFEETFENLNWNQWKREIRIPAEDSAFISYQDRAENVFIKDNNLNILLTTPYSESEIRDINNTIAFAKCTAPRDSDQCDRKNSFWQIYPPVVSAKLLSSFSFLYGKIEIRAKMPIGDWIIPQLLLEPKNYEYSNKDSLEYSSGQLRVGFIRGNRQILDLKSQATNLDGRTLYGGAILEPRKFGRHFLKTKMQEKHYGEDFHIYALVWTENNIELYVDDIKYGTIEKGLWHKIQGKPSILSNIKDGRVNYWSSAGNLMAPFDKEFVISLGVSVGGMGDFPDDIKKPWTNNDIKAEIMFYKDKKNWKKSWDDNKPALIVDYVRVYSV